MQVLQPIGIKDRRLTHEMIVQKSIDWLRGVDKVQISRFQQYDVDGETIGLNLVCVPVTQKNPRLLVAAVRIDRAKARFTSQINSDNDSTHAMLSDDAGTIMIASNNALVGRDVTSLKDDKLRHLASEYLGTGKRGVETIDTSYTLADQNFPPALIAIEPLSIAGKKWTFIVNTPLSDIDNVVNRVFKRAVFWAVFVVGSVMAILVSTSVQLIRAKIRMERVRNDLLTRELSRAREIQLAWLPRQGVAIPCLDVAAVNQPASHISGDFYNWFELPDGRTVVTIGDVTGHGLSAAFLMATTQLLVHTTMLRLEDPGKTLYEVNKQLCVQVFNGQFVTMLICVIDMEAGLLEVATAGHYPPILGKDGEFHSLPVEPQLVLGVEKDVRYPTERFDLPASASLILYTDGVIDAQSPQGKRFDIEQIIESIKGRTDSAQVLLDAIVGRVNHFRQQRKLPDDLTLVCIQTQVETSYNAAEAVSV
jgi:serine phosphatase RsbU (regulator of sigma subunit)